MFECPLEIFRSVWLVAVKRMKLGKPRYCLEELGCLSVRGFFYPDLQQGFYLPSKKKNGLI